MSKTCYDFEILVLITYVINELIFIMAKKTPTPHTNMEVCKLKESNKILFQNTFKNDYRDPIPDPNILIEYNMVIPDGAERIMRMAEKQQEHVMFIEKTVVNGTVAKTKRGQTFGFIITIIMLVCAGYLTFIGEGNVGKLLLGIPLVSLVAVFVVGKFKRIK